MRALRFFKYVPKEFLKMLSPQYDGKGLEGEETKHDQDEAMNTIATLKRKVVQKLKQCYELFASFTCV